jgi:hypothetical protein
LWWIAAAIRISASTGTRIPPAELDVSVNDHDGLDNGFMHAASKGAGCGNRQSGSECEFLHNILQDTPRFVHYAQV